MKQVPSIPKSASLEELQGRVKKLKSDLRDLQNAAAADESVRISVVEIEERFRRQRMLKGPDKGFGNYLLTIAVVARKETVYLPISVGSGKVSTGFVYQVEGTAKGSATTSISLKNKDILKVTAGTILYAKIPTGKTATYKIAAEIAGAIGKEYRLVVTRVNYKLNPNDARYKRLLLEVPTKLLKFV